MAAQNTNHLDPDQFQMLGRLPTNTLKRHPKNIDLTKTELLKLLSCLEGELQARDVTIAALKAEKSKQLLYQAKYGRFGLGDPFNAMQRDSDCQKDNSFDETAVKAMYDNQLMQLENLIETQRKAQIRMREQLVAVEKRYHKVCAELEEEKRRHAQDTEEGDNVTCMLEKERERLKQELEFERAQKKKAEKELKKSAMSASTSEDPSAIEKHKSIALMLINDRKKINEQMVKLKIRAAQLEKTLKDEQAKTKEMAEALSTEGQKSHKMEASLEKNLSDFDTEREQLKLKLSKEEAKTKELTIEIEKLRVTVEKQKGSDSSSTNNANVIPTPRVIPDVYNTLHDKASVGHTTASGTSIGQVSLSTGSHTEKILSPRLNAATNQRPSSAGSSRLSATSSGIRHSPQSGSLQNETRKVPVVHLNEGRSTPPSITPVIKPNIDPSSSVKRAIVQFDNTEPHSETPLSPGGKPVPAEKPVELQSPRVLNPTSNPPLQPANTSVLTVSGGTTVFTTPSGTRISLNVGPSSPSGHSFGGSSSSSGSNTGSETGPKKIPIPAVRESKHPPPIPSKPHVLQSSPSVGSSPNPSSPQVIHSPRSSSTNSNGPSTGNSPRTGSVPVPVQHHQTLATKFNSPRFGTPSYGYQRGASLQGSSSATDGVRKPPPPQSGTNLVQNSPGASVIGYNEQSHGTSHGFNPGQSYDTTVSHDGGSTNMEFLGPEIENLQQLIVSMATEQDQQSSSSTDSDSVDSVKINNESEHKKESKTEMKSPPPQVAAMRQLIREADWSGLKAFAANQRGDDLNEPIDHENTVVHYVTQSGNLECLNVLLSMGADVNMQNCDGLTPLHIATGSGYAECCALLLQYGADVSLTNNSHQTSLHMAVIGGSTDVVQTILDHCVRTSTHHFGETLYMTDNEGCSALFLAAMRNSVDILKILSKYCDLDAVDVDRQGRTIIDVASPTCKEFLKTIEDKPKVSCQVVIENPSDSEPTSHVLGDIMVPMDTTWQDLEELLSKIVMAHFNSVAMGIRGNKKHSGRHTDGGDLDLGLTMKSVKYFGIGKYFWSPGTPSEKLPHELLYNNQSKQISVRLYGLDEGYLDSLTYESLIPNAQLQNYIRLIEQYKCVLFYGPVATGKTYICKKLAQVIQSKEGEQGRVSEVTFVTVHDKFTATDLNSVLYKTGCLIPNSQAMKNFIPIIILDGLHLVNVAETFNDLLPLLEKRGPQYCANLSIDNKTTQLFYLHTSCYILGSMDKNRLPVLDMSVQQTFRWIHMRTDQEPLKSTLHRHFYRKMMSAHGGNISAVEEIMERTVEWVVTVWTRLNEGLAKLGFIDQLLGPNLFLACPIEFNDYEKILAWLKELWNEKIARAVTGGVMKGSSSGGDGTKDGQQKVANTALYVLMQRAVVSGCPLNGHEKEKYISGFLGSNELDIKMRKDRPARSGDTRASSTPRDTASTSNSTQVNNAGQSALNEVPLTSQSSASNVPLQQSRSLGNMTNSAGSLSIPNNTTQSSHESPRMIPINPVAPSLRRINSNESSKSFGSSMFAISGIPARPEVNKNGGVVVQVPTAKYSGSGMGSPKLPKSNIPSPKTPGSGINPPNLSRSILASSPLPQTVTEMSGRASANQSPVFKQQPLSLPQSASVGNIPLNGSSVSGGNTPQSPLRHASTLHSQANYQQTQQNPGLNSPLNNTHRPVISPYQSNSLTNRQSAGVQMKSGIAVKTQDTSSLRRAFSPTPASLTGTSTGSGGGGGTGNMLELARSHSASSYRRAFSPSLDKSASPQLSLPKKQ